MALGNVGTGTQASVLGTEHTLDTDTTSNVYIFAVDTGAMAAGDVIALRVKTKVLSGGVEREAYYATYFGAQAQPQKYSVPVPADISVAVSLQQLRGTFAIDTIVLTVSDGDTVTGATSGAVGIVRVLGGGDVAGSTVVIEWVSGTFQVETVEKDGSNKFNITSLTLRSYPWKLLTLEA